MILDLSSPDDEAFKQAQASVTRQPIPNDELFFWECVEHLSRGNCHCQTCGSDVDRNAHLECCMVGRTQRFLGKKVTIKQI